MLRDDTRAAGITPCRSEARLGRRGEFNLENKREKLRKDREDKELRAKTDILILYEGLETQRREWKMDDRRLGTTVKYSSSRISIFFFCKKPIKRFHLIHNAIAV